jgi:polysaccharide export outer membrane protein
VKFATILAVLAVCATSACSTVGGEAITTGPRYEAPSPEEAYRLGVGDQIRVQVYGETAISDTYTVGTNGAVILPLIGSLKVSGLTAGEVGEQARQRFASGYLKMPSVAVQIAKYRPVYLLGEVSRPGQYDYVPGITVQSAIAAAAGYTDRASKKYVFIHKEGSPEEQVYKVTPALRILPGDTVRVGERYF